MSTSSSQWPVPRPTFFLLLFTILLAAGLLFVVTAVTPTAVVAQNEPTETTYVVQPGDSLSVIAKRFGVSMATIMARNGLSNANFVYIGQQLIIPVAVPATTTVTATATVAPRATAAITDTAPVTGTASLTVPAQATEAFATVTATPTETPAPTDAASTITTTIYTVQAGDTLSAIARRFNTITADLMARNGLRNANYLYVGQRLEVPVIAEPPTDPGDGATTDDEEAEAIRINFAAGATAATVEGTVTFPTRACYRLEAAAGQEMTVAITSAGDLANFLVRAADGAINGGVPLKRLENEERTWQYTLPASGDYIICVATPEGSVDYTVTVSIPVACTSVTQEIELTDWATVLANDGALTYEVIGSDGYVSVIASATNTTGIPQLDQIVYGDFDGDCTEEAGIPLFSGGTAGNVGFLLYDIVDAGAMPSLVAWGEGYKLLLAADAGLLIVSNALYNGWEPNCCPSGISYDGYRLQDGELILVSANSEGLSEMRAETVNHFYTLLQERSFVAAYALLSPAFQAANPYVTWVVGYGNTESIVATVMADPTITDRVTVALEVAERLSSGTTRVRHYSGYWDLTWNGEAPGWTLQDGRFVVVP